MNAFGRKGRGIFMAPSVMEADIIEQFGVEVIGRSDELVEEFLRCRWSDVSPTPAWSRSPKPRGGNCSVKAYKAYGRRQCAPDPTSYESPLMYDLSKLLHLIAAIVWMGA